MTLISLIYASVARPGIGYGALRAILASADAHNERHGLSGILCYGTGAFLQAIEGPRGAVNHLYNRIVCDDRHSDCEILSCGPIEVRSFTEWSMKMISWEEAYTPQRGAVLLRHSGMQQFEPRMMSGRQAHDFLRELAALERRRASHVVAARGVEAQ
jgi:hypothetical protein